MNDRKIVPPGKGAWVFNWDLTLRRLHEQDLKIK